MECAWQSEINEFASSILAHHWPGIPNHGDITKIKAGDLEEVGLIHASYPCQPFSLAGKRSGEADPRHLWPHVWRICRALRPSSGTLPKAGILLRGTISPLHSLGRRTYGDGSSSSRGMLPTPLASDHKFVKPTARRIEHKMAIGNPGNWALTELAAMLPTPAARDWKSAAGCEKLTNSRPLNEVVSMLPTPVTTDAKGARNRTSTGVGNPGTTLSDVVVLTSENPAGSNGKGLPGTGLKLNPRFSLWLMGFPTTWLDHGGNA
jgi:hypothetical protein